MAVVQSTHVSWNRLVTLDGSIIAAAAAMIARAVPVELFILMYFLELLFQVF